MSDSIEIRIDPGALNSLVTEAVLAGVRSGVDNYATRTAIAEAASKAVAGCGLVDMVAAQMDALLAAEAPAVADAIAAELLPQIMLGLREAWQRNVADVVVTMSTHGRYLDDATKRQLRHDVLGRMRGRTAEGAVETTDGHEPALDF